MPEGLIVRSQEQFDSLGKGWVDSPAKFGAKPEAKAVEASAEAEEMPAADAQFIPEFKLDDGSASNARKRSRK